MDMDCSFDAPIFVDFQNMEGEDQKREEAEAYFEIDHEIMDGRTYLNYPKSVTMTYIDNGKLSYEYADVSSL